MKRKLSEDSREKERNGKSSKRKKHEKSKKHKHKHKKRKVQSSSSENETVGPLPTTSSTKDKVNDAVPTVSNENHKAFQPMTKEEWEKEQNKITRVYDEETGRHRLVRGNGEIIEEIVSRDRHNEINKKSTAMDGMFYQKNAKKLLKQ